jgi:hypothetical protein
VTVTAFELIAVGAILVLLTMVLVVRRNAKDYRRDA